MTAPAARVDATPDGDVWRIDLAAADTGNPVDRVMAAQLAEALARRPGSARTVLLLSTGRDFCVGTDVAALAGSADLPAALRELSTAWHEVVRAVLYCPVPVVAGVRGQVAGAGIGLLGACDLVVCGRSTKLRPGYGPLGLSPDGGTSWALTRALGAPRALELLLTDGVLHAADAHTSGLVARLVDDETLVEEVTALARSIAAGPVRAMVRTRGLVRRAAIRTLDEQLEDEARLATESAADPESREGVAAFLAGRRPDFRGSP
ncbi:enoyl-CoA hydratase/isomerase family protein [Modestobacter versicolor]|uniref:enoyl-CoA hydratase/isomerase family protein n=1 Tax=Modestobacter versicolor TaxID=429133 RepID=UPI0034DEA4FF